MCEVNLHRQQVRRVTTYTKMRAVVLGSLYRGSSEGSAWVSNGHTDCLQQETFRRDIGLIKCSEEVAQQCSLDMSVADPPRSGKHRLTIGFSELLGVRPCALPRLRSRLGIRVEEDVVRLHSLVL